MKKTPIESNLTGATIIDRLRKGHAVRRACWEPGFLIRICNESGYDADGLAIFDDRRSTIYIYGSDGYFMHLGYSAQPFAGKDSGSRAGEGFGALWATDWEDHGFVDRKKFQERAKRRLAAKRRLQEPRPPAKEYEPQEAALPQKDVESPAAEPDWVMNRTMRGGHLADIPLPHVRYWPSPNAQYLRKVRARLMRYPGYPHYHIGIQEEDNPIWNSTEHLWQKAWDDKEGQGRRDSDFPQTFNTFRVYTIAKGVLQDILNEHFQGYEVIWDDYSGESERTYLADHGA